MSIILAQSSTDLSIECEEEGFDVMSTEFIFCVAEICTIYSIV